MSKTKIHSDDEKCVMKKLGPISSSLCVVHIIGRRVSGNQDQNLCQDRSLRLQTIVEQSHKLAWRFLSMPRNSWATLGATNFFKIVRYSLLAYCEYQSAPFGGVIHGSNPCAVAILGNSSVLRSKALSDFATDGSLSAKDLRHHGFGFFFFDGLQGFLSRADLEFAESILNRFEVLR
jgi:hypothetical protein